MGRLRDPRIAVCAVLLALLLYALWCVPFVATHDGPNHLANCVLANRLKQEGSSLSRYLELGAPVTTQGFQVMCEGLERAFGWKRAWAIGLAAITAAWALGYALLALAVDRRSPFVFFGFVTALGWCFAMGFVTWMMTCAFAFFVLAFVVSREQLTLRTWVIIALLLALAAISHAFAAAMLGAAIALVALFRADPAQRARAFFAAVLSGVPAAILALLSASTEEPGEIAWRSFADKIADVARDFAGGPWYRSVPPALLAVALLVFAILGAWRRQGTRTQTALAAFALLAFLGYALGPYHYGQWAYFGPRPLMFALSAAPLAVPIAWLDKRFVRASLNAATTAMAIVALAWSAHHLRAIEPQVSEALSGLEAPLKRSGPRLPLMMAANPERDFAEARPLIMILHLYLFDQGGIDPYVWADDPTKDRVVFTAPPPELFGPHPPRFLEHDLECAGKKPSCPPLEEQYETFAHEARAFEDVILFADDSRAREVFKARGFAVDFEHGRLAILRPQSCRAKIHVAAGEAKEDAAAVRVVRSVIGAPVETKIDPKDPSALLLDGPDCGTLLVEPCREAESHRFLPIELRPDHPAEATCTVVR